MTVDLDKIREKLERLSNPGNSKFKQNAWKPRDDGEPTTIRLIDYPFEEDQFVQMWFHYGVGRGRAIPCPRYDGKSCPICEFAKTLDKDQGRPLWAKPRYFAVMVNREDSPLVPKYWGFSKTIYQELLESFLNEDFSQYLEPDCGFDMIVKTKKIEGKKFRETKFTFRIKESKLAETPEELQEIMDAIIPIEEVFPPMTTSEIKERLEEYLQIGEEDPEEDSHETVKGKAEGTEVSVEDVDAELEKALA